MRLPTFVRKAFVVLGATSPLLIPAAIAAQGTTVDPGATSPLGIPVPIAVGYGLLWVPAILLALGLARHIGEVNRDLRAMERQLEGEDERRKVK